MDLFVVGNIDVGETGGTRFHKEHEVEIPTTGHYTMEDTEKSIHEQFDKGN